MASQFYCLPAEIFGLHIFILNALEQTVLATQMNKMLNRCKWLLSYSYSDNHLIAVISGCSLSIYKQFEVVHNASFPSQH